MCLSWEELWHALYRGLQAHILPHLERCLDLVPGLEVSLQTVGDLQGDEAIAPGSAARQAHRVVQLTLFIENLLLEGGSVLCSFWQEFLVLLSAWHFEQPCASGMWWWCLNHLWFLTHCLVYSNTYHKDLFNK